MVLTMLAVKAAVDDGAVWKSERLIVGGTPMWPKVNGTTWDLSASSTGSCRMRELVFKMIKSGTMHLDNDGAMDGTIDVPASAFTSGGNFMLTPVAGNGAIYAELRDPVL